MNLSKILLLTVFFLLVSAFFLFVKSEPEISPFPVITNLKSDAESDISDKDCIPAFADGGGPYYKPDSPFREKISPQNSAGKVLIVEGKVYKNGCGETLPNAILDIWQADETGFYQDEWFRGKVITDKDGTYRFETIIPKGYGEGTGYRPPHIHFKVFLVGQEIITSQMFFPESKGRPGFLYAYIMEVSESGEAFLGYHNIVLPDY
jgi:protocatechuate 3,4-dioxygenase beta subunit